MSSAGFQPPFRVSPLWENRILDDRNLTVLIVDPNSRLKAVIRAALTRQILAAISGDAPADE